MIYRNNIVLKPMLKNHPCPQIPFYIDEVFVALDKLSSDRQYISAGDSLICGKIPYSSTLFYMERKIPLELQDVFEELFLYADQCWFNKSEELRNRKGKG